MCGLPPEVNQPGGRYVINGRQAACFALTALSRAAAGMKAAAARAGQRGGVMRVAMVIGPAPSSRPGPDAAGNLMCQGGHHAACSITRTLTEMDSPGRPGVGGGPG